MSSGGDEEEEEDEPLYWIHDGEIGVDEDEWPDHDERCHGPIDTKYNRRNFPEGFKWCVP